MQPAKYAVHPTPTGPVQPRVEWHCSLCKCCCGWCCCVCNIVCADCLHSVHACVYEWVPNDMQYDCCEPEEPTPIEDAANNVLENQPPEGTSGLMMFLWWAKICYFKEVK
eukprot:TRINITY_DN69845_c0_g1_i1.p2 TRINITY_DN69845_c0_g1~~TRINITY_DN69845_c0_g1_i1.p2  ORF type:complete len:110 (-),score=9.19 TRINITY_DN69845_c0_g1_i1:497-826(-)